MPSEMQEKKDLTGKRETHKNSNYKEDNKRV
jgi:hypothetical protein